MIPYLTLSNPHSSPDRRSSPRFHLHFHLINLQLHSWCHVPRHHNHLPICWSSITHVVHGTAGRHAYEWLLSQHRLHTQSTKVDHLPVTILLCVQCSYSEWSAGPAIHIRRKLGLCWWWCVIVLVGYAGVFLVCLLLGFFVFVF